jgi:hypothetical protein
MGLAQTLIIIWRAVLWVKKVGVKLFYRFDNLIGVCHCEEGCTVDE